MKKICLLFFVLSNAVLCGQHIGTDQCTLQAENKAWITEYKKAVTLDEKIEMIVAKIVTDDRYFDEYQEVATLSKEPGIKKVPCSESCSIRFGMIYSKNKGLVLDLKRNPELEDLIYEFASENIDRIDLNEFNEKDIYNPYALKRSGIVLYTENKDLKKKIRAALKHIAKS
ncbi:MAG: hypothetical protein OQJ83_02650 [Altibacter sp.]|uniref:hypothetical protein n=1 Tax=Altibacter lentus TaxID=1223410 RepID=UPI0005591DB8|nr:hypothetical protein [Altibacter lentus]MCW8980262.1 hypothetical protein [Altibacter sp.]